jgi:hypothetical protein
MAPAMLTGNDIVRAFLIESRTGGAGRSRQSRSLAKAMAPLEFEAVPSLGRPGLISMTDPGSTDERQGSIQLKFEVNQLPLVVPDALGANGRLVLLAGQPVDRGWRLSWASVGKPEHTLLRSELSDARRHRCSISEYEQSGDEFGEDGGWWIFEPVPDTDGLLTVTLWLDDPPWPHRESI